MRTQVSTHLFLYQILKDTTNMNTPDVYTETQLNENEAERLAQDFEAPVGVKEKLQELTDEIYSLCSEHDIPLLLFTTLAKENLDGGSSKLEASHIAILPGNRAANFLCLANTVIEKRIGDPLKLLAVALHDSDEK